MGHIRLHQHIKSSRRQKELISGLYGACLAFTFVNSMAKEISSYPNVLFALLVPLLCFRCFYAVPTFVNVKGMSSKMVIAKKGHLLPCSKPAFFLSLSLSFFFWRCELC